MLKAIVPKISTIRNRIVQIFGTIALSNSTAKKKCGTIGLRHSTENGTIALSNSTTKKICGTIALRHSTEICYYWFW